MSNQSLVGNNIKEDENHRLVSKLDVKPSVKGFQRNVKDWSTSQGSKSDRNVSLKSDLRSRHSEINRKSDATNKSISVASKFTSGIPNIDNDIRLTKLYLQTQGAHNSSVWSHLTNVLNKLISEKPENVIDYFEEYSRKVKEEQLLNVDLLKDIYVPLPHLEKAKNNISLLNSYGVREDEEEPGAEEMEEKKPPTQTDLEETAFYFLEAGIAIPNIQIFNINIAMKKLAEENNLEKSRFWGQIFGTAQDYFVLEYELSDEEYQKRIELDDSEDTTETESKDQAEQDNEDDNEDETGKEDTLRSSTVDDGGVKESVTSAIESLRSAEKQESIDSKHYMQKIYIKEEKSGESLAHEGLEEEEDPLLPPLPPPRKLLSYKIPPLLQPVIKETIKIPAERLGEGINKKIYYVCNTPELEWTELPKVTPEQINVAQQIKAYFTGNLESKIVTYPAFPGQEKHYLRAQIARISAATHVSPVGFYTFSGGEEDEEEEELAEEEEEEGNQKNIEQNKKYQPIPVKELTDPSLTSWVHHSRYILKQGRVDWWSTKKTIVGEEEAEEEQEEEEDEDKEGGEEKETGPALLTPLSEDTPVDSLPAWTVRRTRSYNPNMAGAVVRSTRWPGAAAVAVGKRCDNVYCGWGHKLNLSGFSPANLPHPEYEYDLGPEVLEIQDPTVEVEQAWREAHKKKPPPKEGEEEEEDEEGEEDEEEEEDEDD